MAGVVGVVDQVELGGVGEDRLGDERLPPVQQRVTGIGGDLRGVAGVSFGIIGPAVRSGLRLDQGQAVEELLECLFELCGGVVLRERSP
ncbi:MAG: hypothetical protein JWR35_1135 [Marmoricola sp.]|nr:hypothetical protein [Marmoricola sp.]